MKTRARPDGTDIAASPRQPSRQTLRRCAALLLAGLLSQSGKAQPGDVAKPVLETRPTTLLWLWDRPQSVTSLPAEIGVAYLHATVRLSGARAAISYRSWPLKLPQGKPAMPVIHVSVDNLVPPAMNGAQQRAIREALAHAIRYSRSDWIQLDFEARLSQRGAYLALLRQLQPLRLGNGSKALPRKLSITALASWCMDDPWLEPSMVDEIVPMYFRMGPAGERVVERLQRNGQADVAACRTAAGFMFGQAEPALQDIRRRYLFHPRSWTPQDIARSGLNGASSSPSLPQQGQP